MVLSSPIRVGLTDPTRTFKFDIVHPGKLWTRLAMTDVTHASATKRVIAFVESSIAILLLKLIYVDLALA